MLEERHVKTGPRCRWSTANRATAKAPISSDWFLAIRPDGLDRRTDAVDDAEDAPPGPTSPSVTIEVPLEPVARFAAARRRGEGGQSLSSLVPEEKPWITCELARMTDPVMACRSVVSSTKGAATSRASCSCRKPLPSRAHGIVLGGEGRESRLVLVARRGRFTTRRMGSPSSSRSEEVVTRSNAFRSRPTSPCSAPAEAKGEKIKACLR